MQQLFDFSTTWYFAFGVPQKTSLCSQFCRQNDFAYFKNPDIEEFSKPIQKSSIIEGSVLLFNQLLLMKPQLNVICFGQQSKDQQILKIQRQHMSIGRCLNIKNLEYEEFRKMMYPNLIFFYGPVSEQNDAASFTLAQTINYQHSVLPKNANELISNCKKSENYVVNGLFTDSADIKILQQFFNIKIVHFKYNRIDLPNKNQFFNKEYDLLPFLKTKSYYIPVKGNIDPIKIMDQVGVGLCPRLVFINQDANSKENYLNDYVKETCGLLLDINEIQKVLIQKKLPVPTDPEQRVRCLTQILYKDLNRQQILLTGFPTHAGEFIHLQNLNRRVDKFVDLCDPSNYRYSEPNCSQIYFLENKKLFRPNTNKSLKDQLSESVQYWVVGGASGSGKTAVAEYISKQFGFKFIQFQKDIVAVKEKLANPDEGEEVPLKKIFNHYKNMIKNEKNSTYIFDNLPYENNDLVGWVQAVGAPNVINLDVEENEQIKRTKKKSGEGGPEVTPEEAEKAKQNTQKANKWLQKLKQTAPCARIQVLNYNKPQLLAQQCINSILRPKVFLAQCNKHFCYQNIAVKFDMAYVNLSSNKLRQSACYINNANKSNVLLNYYKEQDESLVSQDLYWIQKNLGPIRYLGLSEPQQKVINQVKFVPEKPVQEEKPKVQGDGEGGQPPVQPPVEEGKKQFNIYEHEWSKPSETRRNLSQWFLNLKKNVVQKKNSPSDCFQNFKQIFESIAETDTNYYEIVQ